MRIIFSVLIYLLTFSNAFSQAMGGSQTFSLWHWIIVLSIILIPIYIVYIILNGMRPVRKTVLVSNKGQLDSVILEFAREGYSVSAERGNSVVLSRPKNNNWLAALLLLFIPLIGWAALIWIIFGNKSRFDTIKINSDN